MTPDVRPRFWLLLCALIATLTLFAGLTRGDETAPVAVWPPAPSADDKSDWIRFKSNEWLRGTFEGLEDDDLEFDSKELDDMTLDWGDIVEVRCAKTMTCLFEEKITVTGQFTMKDGIIVIRTADGTERRFDRERLLGVIRGTPTERNYWSGEITVGLTARSGNTDQVESSLFAQAIRRTPATRATFEFRSAFGEIEDETTVNNHRFNGRYDVTVTRRFYVTPAQVDAISDEFQNIDYRVTPGAGVGYEFIDKGPAGLEAGAGAAYQYTRYESVEAGEDDTDGTAAVYGRLDFDYDITSNVEFETSYNLRVAVPENEDWTHSWRATVEVDLPAALELDVTAIWDRINDPARDSDGVRPEKDDFTLTVGIGWTF